MGTCQTKTKKNDMLTWFFTCRQCKTQFEVPVPRGPREEKELKCIKCGSREIERVGACKSGYVPPGG